MIDNKNLLTYDNLLCSLMGFTFFIRTYIHTYIHSYVHFDISINQFIYLYLSCITADFNFYGSNFVRGDKNVDNDIMKII